MPARRLFFDAGGRAPVTPRTADALRAGLADGWADPARLTAESRRSRALIDGAREAIGEALGVHRDNVHFTSSVPVAIERVLTGVFTARRGRDRIGVSVIERDLVLDTADFLAPGAVDRIDVDADGHVDVDGLREVATHPATALMAIHHVNHEIGTVQRLDAIADITHAAGVPLVVDATASIGHLEAPEHWDALIADPADWGAPAGLGVVALRPQTRWLPHWPEGSDPWAPGGVSVPLALAAAVALQERLEDLERESRRQHALIDRMRAGLAGVEGVHLVGDAVERAPHLLTAAFLYLDGEPLVTKLDREGIAVGSGSACGKATFEPSHVLAAMGALTHGNLRIGLHPGVTEEDVDRFLAILPRVIEQVRQSMTS
ncbi:cysteine desulfurase family protein [Demequina sp. NBRC 110055]|uniref:cysteine desulfurase family protein n=1 Tax=Demequina sp. NBRC 110055 TaxID=1570344 RepID=UPI000A055D6E|nr:aminotransferase class V-fold PLP-dependent enzyme [Demequina sp. NBRC 110055]